MWIRCTTCPKALDAPCPCSGMPDTEKLQALGHDPRRYVFDSLDFDGTSVTWTERCSARCQRKHGDACHVARTAYVSTTTLRELGWP